MKNKFLSTMRVLAAGTLSVAVFAGCGTTTTVSETPAEASVTEEVPTQDAEPTPEENVSETSGSSEAAAPQSLEERMLKESWITREDWPASDKWDEHPDDSIQVCDMFFYNGMTYDYVYEELSNSKAWGEDAFSTMLNDGLLINDFPENVPEDFNPKAIEIEYYLRVGEDSSSDVYACYNDVLNINTLEIRIFVYRETSDDEDSLWDVTVLAGTGSQSGEGLEYHLQATTRSILPTDDHEHFVHSCIRLSKDDVLVPYDLYGNYEE